MKFIPLILIIIVAIVLIYNTALKVVSEFGGGFLTFKQSTSTPSPSVKTTPPAPKKIGKPVETKPVETKPVAIEPPKPQITPPVGFEISQLSPYYKKIRLSSISLPYFSGSIGQFTLRADYSLTEKINVSGFKLKDNKGGEIFIPKAVNDLNPFVGWLESDIWLDKGEYLIVYTTQSPLRKNIRLNKCIGYLNNDYDFRPKLSNSCPSIDRKEIVSFSGQCQNFILSLSSCRVPTPNEINSLSGLEDSACRAFLDKLNYGGCYKKYSGQNDFFLKEWRAWLNQNLPFDLKHDRILLFDRNNLLVDEYVY